MTTKYIKVDWPEYQRYKEHERIGDCYTCKIYGDDDIYALMVPEDLYEEVEAAKLYPAEFNIPLGNILITHDKVFLNGIEYTRNENELKKGSEVILYSKKKGYWKTRCISCSYGLAPIFMDNSLLGINCEIVGIKNNG